MPPLSNRPSAPRPCTRPGEAHPRSGRGPQTSLALALVLVFELVLVAGVGSSPAATVSTLRGAERLHRSTISRPLTTATNPPPAFVPSTAPIQIRIGPYFGWDRALSISNGVVEAVIVPAIGRVMQFRFIGQSSPFWEDPQLRGRPADPQSADWINFGGDKTWPSPQADWEKVTGRAWPPPIAFDSLAVECAVRRDMVVLTSPVDPHYGIQTERVIALDHELPVMTITTTYTKVSGDPLRTGVWIITQLEDPVGVYVPLPRKRAAFPAGYGRQSGDALPAGLQVQPDLLSLTRDPVTSTKIGTESDRLLWVGPTSMLLIESPRLAAAGVEYPDDQSSAEVYTNPNPKPYVELEMLGPLRTLRVGDHLSQTNTYRLFPRSSPNPERDARRVLRLGSGEVMK